MKHVHVVKLIQIFIFLGVCSQLNAAPDDFSATVGDSQLLAWQHKQLTLTNKLAIDREDISCIALHNFPVNAQKNTDFLVLVNGEEVANQRLNCSTDSAIDGIGFVVPFTSGEKKQVDVYWQPQVTIAHNDTINAVAELQVRVGATLEKDKLVGGQYVPVNNYALPAAHTIGNKLFKYEGIGWESNKIAYRYYFDNRGAIDIFAKQQHGLFLDGIGQDGDDYHALNDWGMDVLKVGPSLGLGGIAAWDEGKVVGANVFTHANATVSSGSVAAKVELAFRDWQVGNTKGDLNLSLQINAQSDLTLVSATSTNQLNTWATGIVKHGVNVLSNVDAASKWNYIATWGEQSLNKDNLGMAIFFKHADLVRVEQDKINELVLLKADNKVVNKPVQYYFSANWTAQPNGAISQAAFEQYLQNTIQQLNSPIAVSLTK